MANLTDYANGGAADGAWLRIPTEAVDDYMLDHPDELWSVLYPLLKWWKGRPLERPQGPLGVIFDTLVAGQVRNLETWRKASVAGKIGGKAKTQAKQAAVRENGALGGRQKTQAKQEAARANGALGGRPKNPSKAQNERTEQTTSSLPIRREEEVVNNVAEKNDVGFSSAPATARFDGSQPGLSADDFLSPREREMMNEEINAYEENQEENYQ